MTARCCVVVADRTRARVFLVQDGEGGARRLVEEADLANVDYAPGANGDQPSAIHPQPAARAPHRLSLDRRFAKELVTSTAALVGGWEDGEVVLVAPAHMLGQLRELMRNGVAQRLTLKELAREYTSLSVTQLARQLGLNARTSHARP